MTTLSKLGAKLEELMERNRLLSNLADMKSQHKSRGASYYSGGQSSVRSFREAKHEVQRGRDPDAASVEPPVHSYGGDEKATSNYQGGGAAVQDDPSTYSDMGSTILS